MLKQKLVTVGVGSKPARIHRANDLASCKSNFATHLPVGAD